MTWKCTNPSPSVPQRCGKYNHGRWEVICRDCFEATEQLISSINMLDDDVDHRSSHPPTPAGLERSLQIVQNQAMRAYDRSILKDLAEAFANGYQTDILVKPGDGGPAIPAHKVILALRSGIFKNMLESDGCMVAAEDSITLPDLSAKELRAFLKSLYRVELADEQVEKHWFSLLRAAHKYEVSDLEEICARKVRSNLGLDNVLEVLEYSWAHSMQDLMGTAVDFVVSNGRDIFDLPEFEDFLVKNPLLSAQIIRALYKR